MESVKVHQRVGRDGVLHLEIPLGLVDQDVEVMVIYQPVAEVADIDALKARSERLEKAQALVRKYVLEGQSLVDELISDRRAEAERE